MNHDSSDNELTPAETAAFAALPRETAGHDRLAEERTLHALRRAGLLRQVGAGRKTRVSAMGIGAAAAVLIFVAGTLFGRQLAAREVQSASPSMQVQRAGTAYVAALVRLSGASDTERSPGLEAGTATLRAAATSLAQISPNDPTAARIRTSLSDDNRATGDHSVIWF